MILWLDAHISPKLVPWIHDTFGMDVLHVRDLGLGEAEDPDIFYKAREADAIVITKDRDFVELLGRLGPPPKIIWSPLAPSLRPIPPIAGDVVPASLGNRPLTCNPVVAYCMRACTKTWSSRHSRTQHGG